MRFDAPPTSTWPCAVYVAAVSPSPGAGSNKYYTHTNITHTQIHTAHVATDTNNQKNTPASARTKKNSRGCMFFDDVVVYFVCCISPRVLLDVCV